MITRAALYSVRSAGAARNSVGRAAHVCLFSSNGALEESVLMSWPALDCFVLQQCDIRCSLLALPINGCWDGSDRVCCRINGMVLPSIRGNTLRNDATRRRVGQSHQGRIFPRIDVKVVYTLLSTLGSTRNSPRPLTIQRTFYRLPAQLTSYLTVVQAPPRISSLP